MVWVLMGTAFGLSFVNGAARGVHEFLLTMPRHRG